MYVLDGDSVIRAISLKDGSFASGPAADAFGVQPGAPSGPSTPSLLTGAGNQLYAGPLELHQKISTRHCFGIELIHLAACPASLNFLSLHSHSTCTIAAHLMKSPNTVCA